MANLLELKASREEQVEKLDKLVSAAEAKPLTDEQKAEFTAIKSAIAKIDEDIKFETELEETRKSRASEKFKSTPSKVNTSVGAPQDGESEHKELLKISKVFSLGKALKQVTSRKNFDGAEAEVFEIAKSEAKECGVDLEGNMHIPHKFIKLGQRSALTVATEGTDVVFTEYGGKIIPYLNPTPVADKLGVTFLQGLNGNVQWPRTSNRLSLGFVAETGSVAETTPTLDNISITPKRFGGYVDFTMQMQRQGIMNVDKYIRKELTIAYQYLIDDQLFNGTGASNQTTGLFNASGVTVLSLGSSGGDMTRSSLLSMIRDAEVANAREGKSGFVTNAYGKYALAITPAQASGVEGNFIFNPKDGTLQGEPFYKSNVIPSNFSEGAQSDLVGIIYSSNWAGALVGFWGGLDLTFDPYTQKVDGKDRIIVNGFMDQDIEQPAEFVICKDWDATDLPALT
jgi:HK97 family phage major capsid protein